MAIALNTINRKGPGGDSKATVNFSSSDLSGAGGEIDLRLSGGTLEHYYNFATVGDRAKDLGTATILLDIDVEEDLGATGSHLYVVDNVPGS